MYRLLSVPNDYIEEEDTFEEYYDELFLRFAFGEDYLNNPQYKECMQEIESKIEKNKLKSLIDEEEIQTSPSTIDSEIDAKDPQYQEWLKAIEADIERGKM